MPPVPHTSEALAARRERARQAAHRRWSRNAMGLTALGAVLALIGAISGGHSDPLGQRAASAAAQRPAGPPPPVHFTVEVNGDLLIHSPIFDLASSYAHGRGYDFRPMLRSIRPIVSGADLAICHVETPMTPRPPAGYPVFNTPPALARSIRWAGWDGCDTASNHSLDQGQYGIDQTGRALDRAGVEHTGSFASRAAQRKFMTFRVKGVKVAYLAYTEMTNGIPRPHPWSLNLARAAQVEADARRARRQGAKVVLVNFHWGEEYQPSPSAFQLGLARRLARDRDITGIVGQHVHVVQPIRAVRGKLVVFGEGNLLSNQTAACCPSASQDGLMAILHVTVDSRGSRVDRIEYIPVWVRHPDYRVLPVGYALAHHQADASELRASWARTVHVVGRGPRVATRPRRLPR